MNRLKVAPIPYVKLVFNGPLIIRNFIPAVDFFGLALGFFGVLAVRASVFSSGGRNEVFVVFSDDVFWLGEVESDVCQLRRGYS